MIITNYSNEQKPRQTALASRNLTIFAIEEAPRKMIECARKLRRRVYSGIFLKIRSIFIQSSLQLLIKSQNANLGILSQTLKTSFFNTYDNE